jgi:tellurite resistance protein TehA-like permease
MDLGSVIGMAGFAFGLMAVIALLCAVMIRVIVAILAKSQSSRAQAAVATPVSVSVSEARDETAAHVAAVAAAVYAVVGAHRLVRIGEPGRSPIWSSLGRTQHQTSHTPRLDHH